MSNAAVMEFVGNFCKVKFIVKQQFLYFFNFMDDNEMLYGNSFNF